MARQRSGGAPPRIGAAPGIQVPHIGAATPEGRARTAALDLTPDEDEKRLEFIFRMLARAYSDGLICRIARGELGVGTSATLTLIGRAREKLRVGVEENRPYARAEQVARLRDLIEKLKTPKFKTQLVREVGPGGKVVQVPRQVEQALPAQAIMRAEEQLARVEGNEAPIRVEVAVALKASAMALFANLSEERFAQLLERARERKRLAASVVVEMPKS
jgi:hypothetical protein